MPDSVSCLKCGVDLTDCHCDWEGIPCPYCGTSERSPCVSLYETSISSDHVTLQQERDNKAIGFSESTRQGRASSADQVTPTSQTFQIQGTSPQGEEDSLPTCRILVQKWNEDEGSWAEPIEGQDDDVDCRVESASHSKSVVQIQVVRATVNSEFWKELSVTGRVCRDQIEIDKLACWIKESIKKKAKHIPESRRNQLHLALDATRLPGLGFDDIVENFHQQFGSWASSQGFVSIWLVGPSTRLTWRLD